MPRLTILMPARDSAKTIKLAIRSVLQSAPDDTELVVWNDASTDDTSHVVEQLRDRRVRIIESPVALGGGAARNEILARSDSEFVASMDADDISIPGRLRSQMRELDRQADFTFAPVIKFGPGRRVPAPTNFHRYSAADSRIALLFHSPFSHPTFMGRRASLDRLGGYAPLDTAQDYELWMRATVGGVRLTRGRVPYLLYRQSPTQVSRRLGYMAGIRANPTIWEGYRNLFHHVTSESDLLPASASAMDSCTRSRVFDILSTLIAKMDTQHRRQYRAYIQPQVATMVGA